MVTSTGYGPRVKIRFNRDERKYEIWEAKFMGYLHILKLKETVESEEPNAAKNVDVYAELIQVLDDRSLSLVMREATDDGKKAISILREHYISSGKPKVIALYTESTTLQKGENECVTDYMLRAEASMAALKNAGEEVGDSLLIAMILKGLPPKFKAFNTVSTQKGKQPTYLEFKVSLRAFEENEKPTSKDNVLKLGVNNKIKCYACKQAGHKLTSVHIHENGAIIVKLKPTTPRNAERKTKKPPMQSRMPNINQNEMNPSTVKDHLSLKSAMNHLNLTLKA